ncbi:hypothetical protein AB0G02_01655 [Actinosynnema sp. NPDC023658]|uniref:hypothetical protein n=1 Tax=Actinosynnema sp. NPDC023658 TaxID=3155465 RepID=UPI0033F077AF
MTLNTDRPTDPRHSEPTASPIVVRANKKPRVALWYWLWHPRRALWITLLIREAFRWRDQPRADPSALTWAELAVVRRAQHALREQVENTVKRVDELADRYHQLQARADRERKLAEEERRRTYVTSGTTHVYAAGPLNATQAQEVVDKCRKRIEQDTEQGQTRHLDKTSKGWSVISIIPLVVDVVALFTLIAKFFNITTVEAASKKLPETATALGFSVIAALVLTVLAHSAGHDAWQRRAVGQPRRTTEPGSEDDGQPIPAESDAGEFPGSKFLLRTKLVSLMVVSAMVAVSIAIRVIQPTPSTTPTPLGWVIGLMLGVVAFLAPWAIVFNRLKSGTLEVRTIEELTTVLRDAETAVAGHEKAAGTAADQAAAAHQQADHAQRSGLRAAMNLTDTTREVVDLARSHHGQAGVLAINDSVTPDSRYVAIREMLATSTSAIEQAMKRFDTPDSGTPSAA